MVWAIVPLKSPEHAKSRLSAVLAPGQRRSLFYSMAKHVIDTAQASADISAVLVVTANDEVARFARQQGCRVVPQNTDDGTADAFEAGIVQACCEGPRQVLLLPGDLPLLSPQAVAAMLERRGTAPSVTIAPDQAGTGTNALYCSPAHAMPMCFGPDSFRRHVEAAKQRGIALRIVRRRELALDVDYESDLAQLPSSFTNSSPLVGQFSALSRQCRPLPLSASREKDTR